MAKINFDNTFEYKLIYVFRINDKEHEGYLKIGDATIHTNKNYYELNPSCHDLNYAARKRIDEYTATAGIPYELLYTEIAVYRNENLNSSKYGKILAFRDHDVHTVLKRSGIKNKQFDTHKKQNEWFNCDLETAKKAIQAVKENKSALDNSQLSQGRSPIIFRAEQRIAIDKTLKQFKKSDRMLWNAKMRFGKTLSALQVVKLSNFKKTIIITHRPVVDKGWYEDFQKIFYDRDDFEYGSKKQGKTLSDLLSSGKNFVYFASIEDLRGAKQVGGNFNKNDEVFSLNWDFIIVDEAHEGTKTALGKAVYQALIKPDNGQVTKVLELSGTPFNLLVDYEDEQIYTWDYIMEQEAKQDWALNHDGDSNPYEELPKLNIFTYHLEENFKKYMDLEDKAFKFSEFFRTWTGDINKDYKHIPLDKHIGDFVHEDDIKSFLSLICKDNDETNYPFSTEEYRDFFRHTLWVVPGVKEAKALSALLKSHPIFSQFEIVNVAGDGDEEIDSKDALKAVKSKIGNNPEETRTITLSCGRLTTGVSVPEWTAVLMLAGSYSTQASQYLQTIFRVQTPANINGKIKENCYVFDFAPDRTLKMVAESVQLSARGMGSQTAEMRLGKFLNFCPVIAVDHTGMKEFKVSYLLQELKKAYAERVVRNGFDDTKLYNDELLKLDEVDLKEFERLKGIIGSSKAQEKSKDIDINDEGFTEEEYEKVKKLEKKSKKELTEEEKKILEELKEKRKNRSNAISILRGISIRIPLLVYGADVPINKDITIDEFADYFENDKLSWEEFMPKGITIDDFRKFSKYYDKDIFVASTFRIRYIAKSADELEPTERVKKISQLFSTFKNPDKETVLTPWRVVNMHMSDTIGGYDFWNEDHSVEIENPRFVNIEEVTDKIFNDPNGKVLEINSKTGLYPLYIAYTYYRVKASKYNAEALTFEKKQAIWDEVVRENLFVICKTPMAKQITKRTLLGYRNGKMNAHAFDDLINQLKSKQQQFIDKVASCNFWNKGGSKMKFSAIVGNPPYQELVANNNGSVSQANPVYNLFVEASTKISQLVSLITPSLWMTGGTGLQDFRKYMLKNNHIQFLYDYEVSNDLFPTVNIAGGVSYFLWNQNITANTLHIYKKRDGSIQKTSVNMASNGTDIFIRDSMALNILKKVGSLKPDFKSFMKLVSTYSPFANGIVGNYKNLFLDKETPTSIKIYRFSRNKNDKFAYIERSEIIAKQEWIDEHKVFVSKAGEISAKFNGLPFYGEPGSCCNETYLVVGPFKSKKICLNVIKYMNTSLYKYLISQVKKSQNAARNVYKYVPVFDFESNNQINWDSSLEEIDNAIFSFFKLDSNETLYIKETVK